MGSCTKASPANTTSPMRSCVKLSTRFSISSLLFSKRDGTTSCAIIELLMSTAMMVSMPFRLSWVIFVPICGRANITTNKAKAVVAKPSFTHGR